MMGEVIQGTDVASVIKGLRKMDRMGYLMSRCEITETESKNAPSRVTVTIEFLIDARRKVKKGGVK
jgi:hypothetical protein